MHTTNASLRSTPWSHQEIHHESRHSEPTGAPTRLQLGVHVLPVPGIVFLRTALSVLFLVVEQNMSTTRRMKLHLNSQAEVDLIKDLLHDKSCEAGQDSITLVVSRVNFRPRVARCRAGLPDRTAHLA